MLDYYTHNHIEVKTTQDLLIAEKIRLLCKAYFITDKIELEKINLQIAKIDLQLRHLPHLKVREV